jgi:hypothetical protein
MRFFSVTAHLNDFRLTEYGILETISTKNVHKLMGNNCFCMETYPDIHNIEKKGMSGLEHHIYTDVQVDEN